jgi:glutamine amidotransferase
VLVGILDLGINNLSSVQRAFSTPLSPSDSIVVVEQGQEEKRPELLILPGLGKFGAGMHALQERNLVKKILRWNNDGTKVVGICLGMQLLGTSSEESPGVKGLDLINSSVERLPENASDRIPHIGWAEVNMNSENFNFPSLMAPGDFYFVHSFQLKPKNSEVILTKTPFGKYSFASSVLSNNILGVQFHPEKSGAKGKALISEIIQWARNES